MDSPVVQLRKHLAQLKTERHYWEPYWKDVQSYIAPSRGRFVSSESETEVNRGGVVADDRRINGAASRALGILASGIQSGLTSKARQWFLLTHPDPEVNRYQPAREWYDSVQEVLEGVFRRSNVYSSLLHTYFEMAGFGQGALSVLYHPDRVMYCRPYTTGTYFLSSDQWGDIDCFYHVEFMTSRQLEMEYGKDSLPEFVRSAGRTGNREARFEVVNVLLRHPEQFGLPGGEGIASVHFLYRGREDDKFLRVSRYNTWPVMTPRWDVIDRDVYGTPPTRDIMGDVKMLQRMEADALKGIAKGVTPPMRIPPEMERRGLNLQPGALNVVSNMNEHAVAPVMTVASDIRQLQAKIDIVVQGIKDGLFNSLFLALLEQDNPQMTAREVSERHEEKLLMLGPVLERIHYELLDPLIRRAFGLCYEAGLIPPPPDGVDMEPTEIEYVSILSQAQKAVGVSRIEQGAGFLGSLVSVYPELRHALNPFKAFREYCNMIGVKNSIFASEEEYAKAIEADRQQAQMAQMAEAAPGMAAAAKNMAEVNPADLQRVLTGGMGGPVL